MDREYGVTRLLDPEGEFQSIISEILRVSIVCHQNMIIRRSAVNFILFILTKSSVYNILTIQRLKSSVFAQEQPLPPFCPCGTMFANTIFGDGVDFSRIHTKQGLGRWLWGGWGALPWKRPRAGRDHHNHEPTLEVAKIFLSYSCINYLSLSLVKTIILHMRRPIKIAWPHKWPLSHISWTISCTRFGHRVFQPLLIVQVPPGHPWSPLVTPW